MIEAALEAGWMHEIALTAGEQRTSRRILKSSRLHSGEAEAIALAFSRKLMVLLEDKEARVVAEAMAVQYMGTAGVLLEAFFVRGRRAQNDAEKG